MKSFIYLTTLILLLFSCSKNTLQCSDMKPIKHKKYKVSKKRRSFKSSHSVSTNTGRIKQTNTDKKTSPATTEEDIFAQKDVSPLIEQNTTAQKEANELEVEAKDNTPKASEEILQTINEEVLIEEEQQIVEDPIIYSSNITRLTYILEEDTNLSFDSKLHINYNNKLYSFKENTTFFQSIQYKDVARDVNHVELGTILNQVAKKSKINGIHRFVITSPLVSNKPSLKSDGIEYEILHLKEDNHYEVFEQKLVNVERIIEAEKISDEELRNELNKLLNTRVKLISEHLIRLGVPPENIIFQKSAQTKSIIVEVK